MSSDMVRNALLSRGYFPKELPSAFTTEDFGRHSKDIISEWGDTKVFEKVVPSKKKKKRGSYNYKIKDTDAEIISKPKRGYERRNIHITHPVPQALLAAEMSENWRSVAKWLARQTYSIDEIRVSPEFDRSIKGINFRLHRAKNGYIESTSDWLVRTDITRFYPSIYTHSVAWAAYGKEAVKAKLFAYKDSFADRIDLLLRACNRNQTIGIPIGPETSRVVAEIISSRIDVDFKMRCGNIPQEAVDRLQDDWTVGVQTLEDAEKILSTISSIYRNYGLDINGSKTSIARIIAAKQTPWKSEIGAFLSHRPGRLAGSRLDEFMQMCLRLQADNPSDSVISYALSVLEGNLPKPSDLASIESFLLKAAVVAPNALDRICRIILNLQYVTKQISTKRVTERFSALAEKSLEKGHLFEVIWLLYTLRGLKRPFEIKMICEAAEYTNSSALALLLLDMKHKGQGLGKLPVSEWEKRISKDAINNDPIWLLAYEGFRHRWLTDTKGLMQGALFKPMADRNVVFYDPARNITSSKSAVKKRWSLMAAQNTEVQSLIAFLRGAERMPLPGFFHDDESEY